MSGEADQVSTDQEQRADETLDASVAPFPGDATLMAIERAACEWIREAGAIVLERYRGPLTVEYKDGKKQADPVTEVDRAVEAFLTGAVQSRFPAHAVLGEEGQDPGQEVEFEWIVDPIDGTINFVNRLPFFAISIGVLHRRRPVVGAILLPLSGELLHARRGGGAFRGESPISVHPATTFAAPVPAGLPPGFWFQFRAERAARRLRVEPRSLGSIAYELAVAATGGFGLVAFRGPHIWDVAGGIPILTEAGGTVLAYSASERRWLPLDRLVPPPSRKPDTPPRLRDWSAPVIAGATPLVTALAPHLQPRLAPVVLRRAIAGYRGWRRWLPKRSEAAAGDTASGDNSGERTV